MNPNAQPQGSNGPIWGILLTMTLTCLGVAVVEWVKLGSAYVMAGEGEPASALWATAAYVVAVFVLNVHETEIWHRQPPVWAQPLSEEDV